MKSRRVDHATVRFHAVAVPAPRLPAGTSDGRTVAELRNPAYPASSKKEETLIFFPDELAMHAAFHKVRARSEPRTPPLNTLSAGSSLGHMRCKPHQCTATVQTLCEFLKRLIEGADRKTHLVNDGHRIHARRNSGNI